MIPPTIPSLRVLALAELQAAGAPSSDFMGVAANLLAAQACGQLVRDYDEHGCCTGFVAWLRLTPAQLEQVVIDGRRRLEFADDTPGAPVCFLLEQLNHAGRPALVRRLRMLSRLPGVKLLAGWRGDRMRLHRVRHGL